MGNFTRRSGALAFLAACTLLFVSCGGGGGGHHGGGGGGGGGEADLNSAPGQPALYTYFSGSHQASGTATDSAGNKYTAQFSTVPNAGTSTFNGQAGAYSSLVTLTIDENGAPFFSSSYTVYYLLSPTWEPLGAVFNSGTPYAVVTSFQQMPATITVGGSGPLYDMTYYHDSTMSATDGSLSVTYSVTANNSTSLHLCLQYALSGVTAQGSTDGLVDGTETDCYREFSNGTLTLYELTITNASGTLSFQ